MSDEKKGLYGKFDVRPSEWEHANALTLTPLEVARRDGSSEEGKKHDKCEYFVIDLEHDPYAPMLLRAYAAACGKKFPKLARDLMQAANMVVVHQKKTGVT